MDIRDLLEKSQTISILLPVQENARDLQTAFTLAYILQKKLGKRVAFEGRNVASPLAPQVKPLPDKEKTFAISIRGLAPWISKIYYEKDEKDLRLYFTLKQGEILKENVSLETFPRPDLTIIVGDSTNQYNREREEVKNTTILAHSLLQQAPQFLSPEEWNLAQLLGRTLASASYLKEFNLYISQISRADFEETQTNPKSLHIAANTIKEQAAGSSFVILFESSSGIQTLLWSTQEELRKRFASQFSVEFKGNWTLFQVGAPTLPGAKEAILRALRLQEATDISQIQ